jgi:hypothetical protein
MFSISNKFQLFWSNQNLVNFLFQACASFFCPRISVFGSKQILQFYQNNKAKSRQLPCTLVSPKGRRSNCKSICINYGTCYFPLWLQWKRICVVVSIQDVYKVLLLNVQYIKQISTFLIKPNSCQLPVPGMRNFYVMHYIPLW